MRFLSSLKGIWAVCCTPFLLWLALYDVTSGQGLERILHGASVPGNVLGNWSWLLLFVALCPFLTILSLTRGRSRFFRGLACGVLYFLSQLYWLVEVMDHYGEVPLPLAILALVLLALYMALYMGLFAVLAGWAKIRLHPVLFFFLLPALWVGLDWLRSFLFSGFPWFDLGYGLCSVSQLVQCADLVGHYGLTFLLVLVNSCLYGVCTKISRSAKVVQAAVTLLLLLLVCLYGSMRMEQLQQLLQAAPTARIGVVQGNRAQDIKWQDDAQEETVAVYLDKSRQLLEENEDVQMLVWPETALPFYPQRSELFTQIWSFAREHSVSILTGAPWFEIKSVARREIKYFNSAILVQKSGMLGGIYFKTHLVPFGEYVPLKRFLPFLAPIVEHIGDFVPGTVEKPLVMDSIHSGVLICYESVFPDIARKWTASGANVLINITNDAWYGRTSAPYQSWAMSIVRAVENRRSLVRSANTGVSGFVDPLGHVRIASPLFVPWAASEDVVLTQMIPFYVRWGHFFPHACAGVSLFYCLLALYGRRRRSSSFS